jgi:hypothetical protein
VAIPKTKTLTARLPIELLKAVQYQATVRGATVTELVKQWLQAGVDERERATRRHASMLYEIVKTRAFMFGIAATQMDESQVEKLLTEAEETAKEYVSERLGKAAGTG